MNTATHTLDHERKPTLAELRATPPSRESEVDAWLANYMRCIEEARAAELLRERLSDAAPDMLAALQAESEWRSRDAAGELDPAWDYEYMVGDKRRAAIAKATGSTS